MARRPLLLLATGDVVPIATVEGLAAVEATAVVVVARRDVVPREVFVRLESLVEVVNSSVGMDLWELSVAEADRGRLLGAEPAATWLASGDAFADALAAAAGAGLTGGTFLLLPGENLAASEVTRSWLAVAGPEVTTAAVVGGRAVIDDAVTEQLAEVLTAGDVPFEGFDVVAAVERADYSAGDTIEVGIEACHLGDSSTTQSFPSSNFDADVVEASIGAIVSYARSVENGAVEEEVWRPGECKDYRQAWDQRRGERNRLPEIGLDLPEPVVPPGEYFWAIRWHGQEVEPARTSPQAPSYPDTPSPTFTIRAGWLEPLRGLWRGLR